MSAPAPTRSRAGITLIEMMVTVVIVGVLLAVAVPSISGLIERRRIVAAAGEIADIFAYARSEANTAATISQLTLHLEDVPDSVTEFGSCIRLSTYSASDRCTCKLSSSDTCKNGKTVLLREFTLPRNQTVSFTADATWGISGRVVGFMHGKLFANVQDLVVKVSGTRTGAKLNVEYNNAQRVRICSPDGSIGGFPVCG